VFVNPKRDPEKKEKKPVKGWGWDRPTIPLVPFVYLSELRKTTGTISPMPSRHDRQVVAAEPECGAPRRTPNIEATMAPTRSIARRGCPGPLNGDAP